MGDHQLVVVTGSDLPNQLINKNFATKNLQNSALNAPFLLENEASNKN